MSQKTKGYILASIAAAAYGTNPLFALPLYGLGISVEVVLFWRYLIALPLLGAMIIYRGRSFKVNTQQVMTLIWLGVCVATSSVALFASYKLMDVGVASTMLFVYPLMVALIMAFLFHEKISAMTMGCLVTALVGIAMLMRTAGGDVNIGGTALVMLSALSYAVYIVGVNRTTVNSVATLVVTFYTILFGIFLLAIMVIMDEQTFAVPSSPWWVWPALFGLALFPTVISFAFTTSAIHYIGSTPTAILGALEPLTAVLIGLFMFQETLTPRMIVGLVLIITAVTVIITKPDVRSLLTRVRRMFPRIRK